MSLYPSISLFFSAHPSIYLSVYPSCASDISFLPYLPYLSYPVFPVYPSYLPTYLSICLSGCLSIYLSTHPIYPSHLLYSSLNQKVTCTASVPGTAQRVHRRICQPIWISGSNISDYNFYPKHEMGVTEMIATFYYSFFIVASRAEPATYGFSNSQRRLAMFVVVSDAEA